MMMLLVCIGEQICHFCNGWELCFALSIKVVVIGTVEDIVMAPGAMAAGIDKVPVAIAVVVVVVFAIIQNKKGFVL